MNFLAGELIEIGEKEAIRQLIAARSIVIASGGGGIPVVREDERGERADRLGLLSLVPGFDPRGFRGEIQVMDWGLALPTRDYEKQDSIFATSGLGGTPAFMAPEMATGPLDRIGPASDIYLLGATLFLIVTGTTPHHAKNVTECYGRMDCWFPISIHFSDV